MKRAKVISVINYKGGVGKTVSTYNIGTGLRFLNNHKVLLIDLDPQCSLSTICLKSLSRKENKTITLADISVNKTVNSVIKDYLSVGENISPNIKLQDIIFPDFYKGTYGIINDLDFIPATMFDGSNEAYEKGLDDLEIELAREYSSKISSLNLITLFARFFKDTKIEDEYDFIIFDCPPANNIITQNALIVSDYYLIPTIMDDLSSNGIKHLVSIINNTIYNKIYYNNERIIKNCDDNSQYSYLKKKPDLIGIFETMRKTTNTINHSRDRVIDEFGELVFRNIVYHHIPTADTISKGNSCFSENINAERPEYSPHANYGKIILEILNRLNISKKLNTPKYTDWF